MGPPSLGGDLKWDPMTGGWTVMVPPAPLHARLRSPPTPLPLIACIASDPTGILLGSSFSGSHGTDCSTEGHRGTVANDSSWKGWLEDGAVAPAPSAPAQGLEGSQADSGAPRSHRSS